VHGEFSSGHWGNNQDTSKGYDVDNTIRLHLLIHIDYQLKENNAATGTVIIVLSLYVPTGRRNHPEHSDRVYCLCYEKSNILN